MVLGSLVLGCDHGLVPPDAPETGQLVGTIVYTGEWPPLDELNDLRFVAMRFVPRDTSDFLQLNRMVISAGLRRHVNTDSFEILEVPSGLYPYSGVAQKFDSDLLSWRPVGLYTDSGGVFAVDPNKTTRISILVDFANLPPFPPPQ